MCFRIVETMESPQEVETTDGNHENYHFQANLSQNPGWTPQSNHRQGGNHKSVGTMTGWEPRKGGNQARVETTKV